MSVLPRSAGSNQMTHSAVQRRCHAPFSCWASRTRSARSTAEQVRRDPACRAAHIRKPLIAPEALACRNMSVSHACSSMRASAVAARPAAGVQSLSGRKLLGSAFTWQPARGARLLAKAEEYKVTLKMPDGEKTISVMGEHLDSFRVLVPDAQCNSQSSHKLLVGKVHAHAPVPETFCESADNLRAAR